MGGEKGYMESIYITIISSLLSGIVATFITVIYYKDKNGDKAQTRFVSVYYAQY